MDNLMSTPSTNQTNVVQQQMSESMSTTTNKKLYFKQSATEALHSAILLKARNPSLSSQTNSTNLQSNCTNSNNKILLLNPKQTNQTNLISISSTSNLTQLNPTVINLTDDTQLVDSQSHPTNIYSDELDSPLKIKENILTSIRNLKPVLAGLSSSTSDDDDDINIISDHQFNSNQLEQTPNDVILIGHTQTLPNVNNINNNNNTQLNNTNGIVKLTIPTTVSSTSSNVITAPPINCASVQRSNYLKPNTCYTKLNAPTTNTISTTKLPSALNINSTTTITVTPPIIFNKQASSSLLLAKTQLNKLSVSSKRGKEEALSNSSSSDEETDLHQQQHQLQSNSLIQQQRNSNQKLQLILNNTNPLKTIITSSKQNLLTVNSQPTWANNNKIEQPQITPVVSATTTAAAAVAAATAVSTINTNSLSSVSSSYANSDSDIINSPSSMSSNKSDSDYGSMLGTNSSFSISSPTSCCSSSNSSSCTTNDSSSAIDLNDDNSSTASGPIYVRQPGFDFHAHEVQLLSNGNAQQSFSPLETNKTKSLTRTNKKSDSTSTVKQTNKTNTKAKKKLCMMMMNTELSPITTRDQQQSDSLKQTNNIQLKPISNKAKREPLPMRLRALPPSFWQQPNQPNPSLSTMYLPPLFKNDIIDSVIDNTDSNLNDDTTTKMFDTTSSNYREVRISPANTELLFKLFDNIEQKQDCYKKLQQLQIQYKTNRLKGSSVIKTGLSKALIKGEDPCIVDAVTEGLFPLLRLDSRNTETVQFYNNNIGNNKNDLLSNLNLNGLSNSSPVLCSSSSISGGTSTTTMTTTTSSLISNNNLLPSIQYEQNYSQALSEVVAAL